LLQKNIDQLNAEVKDQDNAVQNKKKEYEDQNAVYEARKDKFLACDVTIAKKINERNKLSSEISDTELQIKKN